MNLDGRLTRLELDSREAILEYLRASGFLERGQLQGDCLVVGGCSRIAYFHRSISLLIICDKHTIDFTDLKKCRKTYHLCNWRQKISVGFVFGFLCRIHLDGDGVAVILFCLIFVF